MNILGVRADCRPGSIGRQGAGKISFGAGRERQVRGLEEDILNTWEKSRSVESRRIRHWRFEAAHRSE